MSPNPSLASARGVNEPRCCERDTPRRRNATLSVPIHARLAGRRGDGRDGLSIQMRQRLGIRKREAKGAHHMVLRIALLAQAEKLQAYNGHRVEPHEI